MNLCKDCKHCQPLKLWRFVTYIDARCGHPTVSCLVTGSGKITCETRRQGWHTDDIPECGREGKQWEKKND